MQDGPAVHARLRSATSVAVGGDGSVFFCDQGNHRVRRVSPQRQVETVAGTGVVGHLDGKGRSACFTFPSSVGIHRLRGELFVTEYPDRIRKIAPDGRVSHVACCPCFGVVIVDPLGNIFVSDFFTHSIRKITRASKMALLGSASCSSVGGVAPSAWRSAERKLSPFFGRPGAISL